MAKGKYAREKATAIIAFTFFVFGLPFLTNVSNSMERMTFFDQVLLNYSVPRLSKFDENS